jgi:hypothetical protein
VASHPARGAQHIIVMAKPDGHARPCRADEVARIHGCWKDTISWLQGADPDELEYACAVRAVAQKAALRMPRYSAYDIATWIEQARDLPLTATETPDGGPLIWVAGDILASVAFTCTGNYSGWLNRITIELLYRQANAFRANRDLLVHSLLKGPVAIAFHEGSRGALAHALKLVIRSALTSTPSSLTNLIHLDLVTEHERRLIAESLAPDLRSRHGGPPVGSGA